MIEKVEKYKSGVEEESYKEWMGVGGLLGGFE